MSGKLQAILLSLLTILIVGASQAARLDKVSPKALASAAPPATGSSNTTVPAGATPTGTPGCEVAWRVLSSPNAGSLSNWLQGVSAISANDAWAVGYTNIDTGGGKKTLVEHWNGARWDLAPSPNIGYDPLENELNAVAALAPNNVWAVGWFRGPFVHSHTLVEHWDGTHWSLVPSPDGDANQNYLQGVSARAPDDIWAVGYSESLLSSYPQTLVLHWDGMRWNLVPSPNFSSFTCSLASVTAIAKNDVWAVGYYYAANQDALHGLVEHWDGTQWSIVPSPDAGVRSDLQSVFASGAGDVWAVGYYNAPGPDQTLIEHWDGTQWSIVPSPNVGSLSDNLNDVSGGAPGDVWAVGNTFTPDGSQTLALHWDGSNWSVQPSSNPWSLNDDLLAVSAASATDVWAVGDGMNPRQETQTVIERHSSSCATPVPTSTPLATPAACAITDFSDVPVGSAFYSYVRCLSCAGIISGYSDGTFRPGNNVTRGQLCKVVVLAAGWQIDTTGGPHFSDVTPGNPFYDFIETAYHHDVISGYSDGTFRPGNVVTRGQLAKIISLAAGFYGLPGFQIFEDVPPGDTFFDYVQMLGIRQAIGGYRCESSPTEPCVPPYERTYLRPGNSATRGQVSKVVASAFFPDCGSSAP